MREIREWQSLSEGRFTPPVPLFTTPTGRKATLDFVPYATTLTRITAFPDTDYPSQKGVFKSSAFTLWERAAQQMNRDGWNIKMSSALEDSATIPERMDKIDVADLVIEKAREDFILRHTRTP